MREPEFQVLHLGDRARILDVLEEIPEKDVHHHPDYLASHADYRGYEAVYAHSHAGSSHLLVPYFLRPAGGDGGYRDLVSPWYYGGPVWNVADDGLRARMMESHLEGLAGYCADHGIVSEFQRLHPLLANHELYGDAAAYDREIAYIDLRKDLDVITEEYSRHTRKNLNKARRNGLRVYRSDDTEDVRRFLRLYTEAMERKGARDFYYFDSSFIQSLRDRPATRHEFFHVEIDGKVISSTLVLGAFGILHDYLRAANPEHLSLRPNDLVIDEIAKWAKKEGYRYYVLGGGRTRAEDDGLLRFKKSFTATTAAFHVYKHVHDRERYVTLCEDRGISEESLEFTEADHFPEYAATQA